MVGVVRSSAIVDATSGEDHGTVSDAAFTCVCDTSLVVSKTAFRIFS